MNSLGHVPGGWSSSPLLHTFFGLVLLGPDMGVDLVLGQATSRSSSAFVPRDTPSSHVESQLALHHCPVGVLLIFLILAILVGVY